MILQDFVILLKEQGHKGTIAILTFYTCVVFTVVEVVYLYTDLAVCCYVGCNLLLNVFLKHLLGLTSLSLSSVCVESWYGCNLLCWKKKSICCIFSLQHCFL